MSALEEAVCPVDGAILFEQVSDGPLDEDDVFAGGPFFECPRCLRCFFTDDPVVWMHFTAPSEL